MRHYDLPIISTVFDVLAASDLAREVPTKIRCHLGTVQIQRVDMNGNYWRIIGVPSGNLDINIADINEHLLVLFEDEA